MGFDRTRVAEVYVCDPTGQQQVGSGYLVSDQVLVTARHVVAGLPVNDPADAGQWRCEVRSLGQTEWLPAYPVWPEVPQEHDVALLRLAADWQAQAKGPTPRWGRLEGVEPIACTAVGFPWAQARPDQVRDTEQLFGHIAPLTTSKAGRLAVNVVTASPTVRPRAGSPWGGMSGAALFAGPYLVGVVAVDPARYGPDRVVATPISAIGNDPSWWRWLDGDASGLVAVRPRFRLAVTTDLSLVLAPPYWPLPAGLDLAAAPARLLLPEHGIVPFLGREHALEDLAGWCATGRSLGLRVVTGSGGAGKTRLAAELCVRLRGDGWDTGFADPSSPGGEPLLEFERRTLLVIDDADVQAELVATLLMQLAYQADHPPLRLLLLARHQGAWWEQLNTRSSELANGFAATPLALAAGALSLADRERHRDAAAAIFAPRLPVEHQAPQLPDGTEPPRYPAVGAGTARGGGSRRPRGCQYLPGPGRGQPRRPSARPGRYADQPWGHPVAPGTSAGGLGPCPGGRHHLPDAGQVQPRRLAAGPDHKCDQPRRLAVGDGAGKQPKSKKRLPRFASLVAQMTATMRKTTTQYLLRDLLDDCPCRASSSQLAAAEPAGGENPGVRQEHDHDARANDPLPTMGPPSRRPGTRHGRLRAALHGDRGGEVPVRRPQALFRLTPLIPASCRQRTRPRLAYHIAVGDLTTTGRRPRGVAHATGERDHHQDPSKRGRGVRAAVRSRGATDMGRVQRGWEVPEGAARSCSVRERGA